jgi:hypothetical protein
VATGVNAPGLWVLRPDGSSQVHFPDPLDEGGSSLIWAPDSQSLYVQRWFSDPQDNQSTSRVRQGLDGSVFTFPTNTSQGVSAVSSDGRYLAEQDSSGTNVIDATNAAVVRHIDGYTAVFVGPTSLITTNGYKMSRTDVTTGETTTSDDPLPPTDRVFASADGRLVGAGPSKLSWWDADHGLRTLDLGGAMFGCDATADLDRIACKVEKQGVEEAVEVTLETGAVRHIPIAGPISYSPDGRLAYAVAQDASRPFRKSVVIEQADGSVKTLVPATTWHGNELVPTTIDWSPDGASLAVLFWPLDYGY